MLNSLFESKVPRFPPVFLFILNPMQHYFQTLVLLPLMLQATTECNPTAQHNSAQAYFELTATQLNSPQNNICEAASHLHTYSANSIFRRTKSDEVTKLEISGSIKSSTRCASIPHAKIEIWHSQPNGKYASLQGQGQACRGVFKSDNHGSFEVQTMVPGTYGALNGLSPLEFDFPPFGPKLIHFRISADGFKTLVTQAVVTTDGGVEMDLRGPELVLGSSELPELVSVSSTNEVLKKKIKFVLEPGSDDNESVCPSGLFYGFPTSFFTESIAICKPALLKYFTI